jgi:hypothetical protein
MNEIKYPIKITSNGYEVIASGVVHITEPEIKFEVANLTVQFQFRKDTGGGRFEGEIDNNKLIIKLFNFANSLGEGKLEPVEIGTLDNKRLYATWYVNTIENSLRQFSYTFMLKDA